MHLRLWKIRAVPALGAALFVLGACVGRITPFQSDPNENRGRVPAWDGGRPIVGDRPFRAECSFFDVPASPAWPAHTLCLRGQGDHPSDAVRLGVSRCDSLRALWDEPLLPQRPEDGYVELGAGAGECAVAMAATGVHVVAAEAAPEALFRLTSSVVANRLKGNVTVYRRSADAIAEVRAAAHDPKGIRVRLLRVNDAPLSRAADVLATFPPNVARTVLVVLSNATHAREPCQLLEARGYVVYEGGQRRRCANVQGATLVGHLVVSSVR